MRLKHLPSNILKISCWIALFFLFLSSFSDRVPPSFSIVFAFLGLFFPFIFALNLFFFLICILFRQWKQIFIFIGVFLICSGAIRTYFPFNSKTQDVPEDCIKILTYNVMRFEYLKQHTPQNHNPIVQYMVDADADIICIQEYGVTKNNPHDLNTEQLFKALKKTPYRHIENLKFPYSGQTFGLAIFSKYPIIKTERIHYDSEYNGSFVTELDINGKRVTLINNHLESNKLSQDERTGYYDLTKEINTEKLEAITHTMFKRLSPAYKARASQANLIADVIKKNKNPYIIVCGDFNDTPISYARHKIKGNLKDAFATSGRGVGTTYNRHRFLFRIDYILYSKNIKAYNCTVGKLKNSDHYPVSTYLQFLD
jgi:endonuclease/exonuclease/phosphatase family metal-dependent hydrolase